MTINNDDSNNEIFDMGTFNLEGDSNNQTFPDDLSKHLTAEDIKKGGKPLVNTVMKEVLKTTSKKSEEQIQEHQSLVIMLSRYGGSKRFAEYLKSMGFVLTISQLKKLELDELTELLQRVKTSIDNKNVTQFWNDLVFGCIQTGEVIAVNTTISQRLKLNGITDALKGDETFLDLIEQVELLNQNLMYTSPYVRLVYAVCTSAMKVHSVNTMLEKRMKFVNEGAPEIKPEDTTSEQQDKNEVKTSEDEPKKKECILSFE